MENCTSGRGTGPSLPDVTAQTTRAGLSRAVAVKPVLSVLCTELWLSSEGCSNGNYLAALRAGLGKELTSCPRHYVELGLSVEWLGAELWPKLRGLSIRGG